MSEISNYDDIINLPHHRSETRPHMSIQARAAQFSAFEPLSGHGEAIRETEKRFEGRMEEEEHDNSDYWESC